MELRALGDSSTLSFSGSAPGPPAENTMATPIDTPPVAAQQEFFDIYKRSV
jgi:hypothetical protein